MPRAAPDLRVDWNNDGDYDDTGENVTGNLLAMRQLTATRGKDQIRALAPASAGRFDCELNNRSRIYSPGNAAGPLYGLLLPGRRLRLQAVYSATTYDLWQGFLDTVHQRPEKAQESVNLPAFGWLSKLAGKKVSTGLYQTIRTDEALGYILDAVGCPVADRVLSTGQTTLDWWWLDDEDALQAAAALLSTEGPGAALYEDGRGRIVFEDRHYRLVTARCTASQVTIRGGGTEPIHSPPPIYDPGLKDIINLCSVQVRGRSAKALAVVWALGASVSLAPGESRQYVATSSDPFTAAVAPVDGVDFTVTAGSVASAALDRTSGARVAITITAGAAGATITGLQLRAHPVTVDSTTLISQTIDTTASQAAYGPQIFDLAVRAEIGIETAQDLANAIPGRYQNPRPVYSIRLNNGHADRLAEMLSREISDRITIVDTQLGVNEDYFIEQIEHAIRFAGNDHVTTFGCELASDENIGVFGLAQFDLAAFGF